MAKEQKNKRVKIQAHPELGGASREDERRFVEVRMSPEIAMQLFWEHLELKNLTSNLPLDAKIRNVYWDGAFGSGVIVLKVESKEFHPIGEAAKPTPLEVEVKPKEE